MSPPVDADDELLKRFAALRGVPSELEDNAEAGPSRNLKWDPFGGRQHVSDAARRYQQENDDLERIADGRPVDPGSEWGSIRSRKLEDEMADDEVARRLARLAGTDVDRGEDHTRGDTKATLNDVDDVGEQGDDIDLEAPLTKKIEAYLSSLSDANDHSDEANYREGLPPPTKRDELDDLAREAESLLRGTAHLRTTDTAPVSKDQTDDVRSEEEETEAQILERALAEAQFEEDDPDPTAGTATDSSTTSPPFPPHVPNDRSLQKPADIDDSAAIPFSFPSLPTHALPPPNVDDDSIEEDPAIAARLALLMGLSKPTSLPGAVTKLPTAPKSPPAPTRQAGQGWNLPGWNDGRDDDLESWCCICNKDATIQCSGCHDDLYCEECWRDGHGPGGEQGHKAKRFNWKAQQTRVAAVL